MRLIFNLTKIQTKLFISIIVLTVFFILNKTIPPSEFSKDDISSLDLLYYTLLTHMGIHYTNTLKPVSVRAKTLTMCHLIISYIIFLL